MATIVPLPNKTNGYCVGHRQCGRPDESGCLHRESHGTGRPQAVVLTSRAWGHEGGNDLTAEGRDPQPCERAAGRRARGEHPRVTLATDAAGDLSSTTPQVIAAIAANPGVCAKLVATTYRGNAGTASSSRGRRGICPTSCPRRQGRTRTSSAARSSTRAPDREEPARQAPKGITAVARRLPLLPAARP